MRDFSDEQYPEIGVIRLVFEMFGKVCRVELIWGKELVLSVWGTCGLVVPYRFKRLDTDLDRTTSDVTVTVESLQKITKLTI